MMFWSDNLVDESHGVTVSAASRDQLLADLETRLISGAGFSVATLNLDHVVKLRQSDSFRRAYLVQTHVTADGNPIVWLLRLAGRRVELITGSDLVDPIAAMSARLGMSVAMLGSTSETLNRASEELVQRHPGFQSAVLLSPDMGFDPVGETAKALIAEIGRSGARLCFVALGAPKQEIFVARAQSALPGVGFVSIGAGLDFIAGSQRRAPAIVRRFAAEWLWRLASDPGRLAGRYAACAGSVPGLAISALKWRLTDAKAP
jgi:exopolysaccharide biosynthesis WecB/TagA/CpsF family protein